MKDFWETMRGKGIVIILVLFLCASAGAFLVERFGFDGAWNPISRDSRGMFPFLSDRVSADGFVVNGDGGYVAVRDGSALILPVDGYVYDLRLNFEKTINFPLSVSYVSDSGEERMVENELQKFMVKRGKTFGYFLIWHVGEKVKTISIRADRAGTEIAEIQVDNIYPFNPYRCIWLLGLFFLIGFLGFFWKGVVEKPEFGFLVIALTCGTVLVFCAPTNAYTWDEKIHYQHSEKIAYHIRNIPFRPGAVPFSFSLKEKSMVDAYVESQYKEPKKDPDLNNSWYSYVGYIPSITGLTLGEVLPVPHTWVYAFGRWMNLLFYVGIVFAALRKLQSGKMILSVIALFPTAIFLGSNYDYDGWTIACMMLGAAYVFSELQQPEKKISQKDVWVILVSFILGLGSKLIYFPLAFLVFLLGPSKFNSLREYRKYLGLCIIGAIVVTSFFWVPLMLKPPLGESHRGEGFINGGQQVDFILSEPVVYVKILLNSMYRYLGLESFKGMVTFFAYLGEIGGHLWIFFVLVLAVFFDRNTWDKRTSGIRMKFLMGGIFLGTVALFSTGLYIIFTAVRSEDIMGVQPRYMLPLLFPLLYVMGSSRIKNPIPKIIFHMGIFVILSSVFLSGVWELIVNEYY